MRLGEIGEGPLTEADGTVAGRLRRRLIGIPLELLGFVVVTALLPVLVLGAAAVDLVLWLQRRKPWVGIRLVAFLWAFLATEVWAYGVLAVIWIAAGGPFGKGSMRRRRGIYWLRPRWARTHLGTIGRLFGLRFEVEGLELADAPAIILIRHASIIDNMISDTFVAYNRGTGLRYVIKRELQSIGVIDIGGRWVPTTFLRRTSDKPEGELAKIRLLAHDLGPAEQIVVYPEGTRATTKKIARAKEILREGSPEISKLAERMVNLLPPRLGGTLALLEQAPELDVIICGHVGFDGYQYISDIWRGDLVGAEIRVKFWRIPAEQIPRDEQGRIEWLYAQWHQLDDWVGHQREQLGSSATQGVGAGARQ